MFASIVAAVKENVVSWIRVAGKAVKKVTKPTSVAMTLVAAAAGDMTRSTAELVAENALLRQQLIVLWRSVDKPRTEDGDRLLMVLLARLNTA